MLFPAAVVWADDLFVGRFNWCRAITTGMAPILVVALFIRAQIVFEVARGPENV